MQTTRIGSEWLLKENVDAFLDSVFHMYRADVGARCAQGNITGSKNVDGLFVSIETDKLASSGRSNTGW